MFATTTVVLPDKPGHHRAETAVDYTLYGDSVYLITRTRPTTAKPA